MAEYKNNRNDYNVGVLLTIWLTVCTTDVECTHDEFQVKTLSEKECYDFVIELRRALPESIHIVYKCDGEVTI